MEISAQQHAKYLGINIDHKINFNYHLQLCKQKTLTRAKHFRKITFKDRQIHIKHLSKIYKSICRPIIEYGHPILMNCKKTATNKIKTAETCAIRSLTRIRHPNNPLHNPPNTLLYELTNITPVLTRTQILTKKFASEQIASIQPLCIQLTQDITHRHKHPTHTIYQQLERIATIMNGK